MIKNITIEGLRGFQHIELDDFKRINLLVGKNNSGKTTILEGLFFLIGASNPRLPLIANINRGLKPNNNKWNLFFNKLNSDSIIKISGYESSLDQGRMITIRPNTEIENASIKAAAAEDLIINLKDVSSTMLPPINGLLFEYTILKNKKEKGKKSEKYITKIYDSENGIKVKYAKDYQEKLYGFYLDQNEEDTTNNFNQIQIKKLIPKLINVLNKIEPSSLSRNYK